MNNNEKAKKIEIKTHGLLSNSLMAYGCHSPTTFCFRLSSCSSNPNLETRGSIWNKQARVTVCCHLQLPFEIELMKYLLLRSSYDDIDNRQQYSLTFDDGRLINVDPQRLSQSNVPSVQSVTGKRENH